jgi:hypothetical protein
VENRTANPALNWDRMVYLAVMPATEPNPGKDQPTPPAPVDVSREVVAAPGPKPEPPIDLRLAEDLLDRQENLARGKMHGRLQDLLLVVLYLVATLVLVGGITWAIRGRLW